MSELKANRHSVHMRIRPDVYHRFRIAAAVENVKVNEAVEEAMEIYIKAMLQTPNDAFPYAMSEQTRKVYEEVGAA